MTAEEVKRLVSILEKIVDTKIQEYALRENHLSPIAFEEKNMKHYTHGMFVDHILFRKFLHEVDLASESLKFFETLDERPDAKTADAESLYFVLEDGSLWYIEDGEYKIVNGDKLNNIEHDATLNKNSNPDFLHINEEQKNLITSTAEIVSEHTDHIEDLQTNKQDKLTAGENIVISDNIISADLSAYLTTDEALNTYETIENVNLLSNIVSGHTGDISDLQTNKADKATTLSGYGITDAYTKTESDNKYTKKELVISTLVVTSNTTTIDGNESDIYLLTANGNISVIINPTNVINKVSNILVYANGANRTLTFNLSGTATDWLLIKDTSSGADFTINNGKYGEYSLLYCNEIIGGKKIIRLMGSDFE